MIRRGSRQWARQRSADRRREPDGGPAWWPWCENWLQGTHMDEGAGEDSNNILSSERVGRRRQGNQVSERRAAEPGAKDA